MEEKVNGVMESESEDERAKLRPADIDADVREMERRKRVEMMMSSRLFREELERIVEAHVREGGHSVGVGGILQQIQDMMSSSSQVKNSYGFRNSNCVIPINDIRGVESMGYAKGEKILRCKLAAVYRLMDLYGWTQGINNHITGRLNQEEEHILVNAYGMLYHEITASSLVKVDMQGSIVEPGTTNYGVNVNGFQLHAAIHSARPDLKCIIHVHTPAVLAVSSLKCGLLPLSEESVVIGEVSSHQSTGSLQEPEEKDKLARNLGPINKVLLLSNNGAVCGGTTVEEAFFNVYNTVLACESQIKLMPLGVDNLILIPDETRKALYDQAQKVPDSSALPSTTGQPQENKEKRWRIGGLHFEALMRMLDNAGFRTGYIYRTPLVKGEPPKPRNDVEVPPAVSSLGYLLEEEELFRNWKKLGATKNDRTRWLNSPNVYQKVEILETGTPDPKKITKWVDANAEEWVAEGSPTHSSTPVKITSALQFVPTNTNPKEFKKLQQQIKENRRADKITSGPQSHILEGVSWEEAKKLQDANMSATGDQVVLVGAASKGIIQREFQHNATVYKTPYAKNPFDQVSQQEIEEYKKVVTRKQRGESYDEDQSESEALSSSAALPPSGFKSPPSETEDDSRTEPRVLRIETKTAPVPSQAEYVLSDDDVFLNSPSVTDKATNHFSDGWGSRSRRVSGERIRCYAKLLELPSPARKAMTVKIWSSKLNKSTCTLAQATSKRVLCSRSTQTILHMSFLQDEQLCSVESFGVSNETSVRDKMAAVIGELNKKFHLKNNLSDSLNTSEVSSVTKNRYQTETDDTFDDDEYSVCTVTPLPVRSLNKLLESCEDFTSDETSVSEQVQLQAEAKEEQENPHSLGSYIGSDFEGGESLTNLTFVCSSLNLHSDVSFTEPKDSMNKNICNGANVPNNPDTVTSHNCLQQQECEKGNFCVGLNNLRSSEIEQFNFTSKDKCSSMKEIPDNATRFEDCDPSCVFQVDEDEISVNAVYDSKSVDTWTEEEFSSDGHTEENQLVIIDDIEKSDTNEHPMLVDENIFHGKRYLLGRYLSEPSVTSESTILKHENLTDSSFHSSENYSSKESSLVGSFDSSANAFSKNNTLKATSEDSALSIMGSLSVSRIQDSSDLNDDDQKLIAVGEDSEMSSSGAFSCIHEEVLSTKYRLTSMEEFLIKEIICEVDPKIVFHKTRADMSPYSCASNHSLPLLSSVTTWKTKFWSSLPNLYFKTEDNNQLQVALQHISSSCLNINTPTLPTIHSYYTLVTGLDKSNDSSKCNSIELSYNSSLLSPSAFNEETFDKNDTQVHYNSMCEESSNNCSSETLYSFQESSLNKNKISQMGYNPVISENISVGGTNLKPPFQVSVESHLKKFSKNKLKRSAASDDNQIFDLKIQNCFSYSMPSSDAPSITPDFKTNFTYNSQVLNSQGNSDLIKSFDDHSKDETENAIPCSLLQTSTDKSVFAINTSFLEEHSYPCPIRDSNSQKHRYYYPESDNRNYFSEQEIIIPNICYPSDAENDTSYSSSTCFDENKTSHCCNGSMNESELFSSTGIQPCAIQDLRSDFPSNEPTFYSAFNSETPSYHSNISSPPHASDSDTKSCLSFSSLGTHSFHTAYEDNAIAHDSDNLICEDQSLEINVEDEDCSRLSNEKGFNLYSAHCLKEYCDIDPSHRDIEMTSVTCQTDESDCATSVNSLNLSTSHLDPLYTIYETSSEMSPEY